MATNASRQSSREASAPDTAMPKPVPMSSPDRIMPMIWPRSAAGKKSPTSDATAGRAAAVTTPRNTRDPSSQA